MSSCQYLLRAGLGCILTMLLACGGPSVPEPPSPLAVEAALGPPIAEPPANSAAAPKIQLFIDASESMRGFVSKPDSAYIGAISGLLDRAATSGFPTEAFSFAGNVRPLESTSPNLLLSNRFYNGAVTSFPNLFHEIALRWPRGAVSVIVSDLVQSSAAQDQRELSRAFQELAKLRPEVLLLGTRSSFFGRYFVEGRMAGTTLSLALDGYGQDRGRPVYFLVVAPSRAALAAVERLLLPSFDTEARFDSTTPGLGVAGMRYLPVDSEEMLGWNARSAPRALASAKGPRSLFSFEDALARGSEKGPLTIRLAVAEGDTDNSVSRIIDPGAVELEGTVRAFTAGKWGAAKEVQLEREILFAEEEKRTVLDLHYSFHRPRPFSWDAYRIRVFPGRGNIRLPIWVGDWSTPDDSLSRWGNRTLKLDVLIETLYRSLRERIPVCEQYILLGRGE